jgi:hypothetical protein
MRSLKKTAEITPRLAVLPSACPYEPASVVNSKRRASDWLVCHPLIALEVRSVIDAWLAEGHS